MPQNASMPDDSLPTVRTPVQAQAAQPQAISGETPQIDLNWVWKEVGKRVFLKIPFSLGIRDALEAARPIALDGDAFVVGFDARNWIMAPQLSGGAAKNTIENILRGAAGKPIHLEVIEGSTPADWEEIKARRERAQNAMIAMASSKMESHHFEDVMSQIVGEVRSRVSQIPDRTQPVVRAALTLDIAASLADAEDMLFSEADTREGKRAMSRVIDRIATFLDVPPLILAIEIERHRRAHAKP